MSKNQITTRIIVPCQFAYFNCWRPVPQYNGTKKYTMSLVIEKKDEETIVGIEDAIEQVKEKSVQLWGGRVPLNLRIPLRDGDEEKPDNPIFKGSYFINAKSKDAPQIVDSNLETITDETEVYSGCYGKVSVIFYSYNFGGARGIAAWIGNIQKLKDGVPFTNRISAQDEFRVER